ncbi:MAG TPA: SpoIIE family protein phosphatase [Negativicutes bacterium]|nr:SpoIIE family protein phosphatase [Negativicutes bacterium]
MSSFIDVSYNSLIKYGEELCGDKVEVVRTGDSVVIVISDGLGSGVKANILATLTCKIAATMLTEGVSLPETVDTIMQTLPVCSVRKLAYSTFTIIKIHDNGQVYVAEYDNPPMFLIPKDKEDLKMQNSAMEINNRVVKESSFLLNEGDALTVVSDGVVHAGVGGVLNLGWQWGNVEDYLVRQAKREKCAANICKSLLDACYELYAGKPGDDATVVTVKLRHAEEVDLFTGPPKNPCNDSWVMDKLRHAKGRRVICGGTAAKIAARELHEEIVTNLDFYDHDVPPTAHIKGIDLVTEGVLTLRKTIDKLQAYMSSDTSQDARKGYEGLDGASQLARLLLEDCTQLNLWVGKAVNPAHQNPDFPLDLGIKLKVVSELADIMEKLGKKVQLTYI